jgi:hypothetical protein
MPSDFPRNDLQKVWQNQPTEVLKMSVDKLRLKAQQADRKARSVVLTTAAIAIALFFWFGWGFLSFPEKFHNFAPGSLEAWSMRLGFGVLSLWSLYSGYTTYKVLWPTAAASDADLKTTLQSYRQQLEKRRDYLQHVWLQAGLTFCFLGMAMVVLPTVVRDITTPLRMLANVGPIFALFILWLAIFIPRRIRRQRTLQQEIDQLRALESGYQA